ncbi:hypothetical protein TRICI_004797 [Trichomonascus ciferrii]|uniref:Uncharacterized protein n=1 Tax=Trichomonascus ciferrii TaxID=44093 RepID=A0A642UZA4_9ASCO|nr:hypothetical protein TRICI_004797 [Trichomonascus ciferrii]
MKLVSQVKLKRDFLSIYPQIYCSVISGLFEQDMFKQAVEFHREFFVPDKSYSRDALLAVLKLGLPKSIDSLRCVEKIYKMTPRGAIDNIFDEFVPWLMLSKVEPRLASKFMMTLLEYGDFPENNCDALEKVVREDPSCAGHLISVVLPTSYKNGHVMPYKTLKTLVKLSSELVPRSLSRIRSAMSVKRGSEGERFKDAVDPRIWGKLIQYHPQSPVDTVVENLQALGVDTNSEYIQEGRALRAPKIRTFDSVVKNNTVQLGPKVWGHGIFLHTRRNPQRGRALYHEWKEHYDSPHLDFGYMKGLYYARKYRPLIEFHESLNARRQSAQSWNYYLSASARSRRAKRVIWAIEQMVDHNMRILPQQVSDSIVCLLEHGRIVRGTRHSYISRPLHKVSPKIASPPQYEPFDIQHIEALINRLASHGCVYPAPALDRLFTALDNVGLTRLQLENFLLCITKSWVKVASHTWDDTKSGELFIFFNSFNSVKVFSADHVYKLVYLGFKTSPRKPWRILRLIHRIRNLGIVIEEKHIMHAFMTITKQVYGRGELSGEMKRIRSQLDPNLSSSDVVSEINHAWRTYAQK